MKTSLLLLKTNDRLGPLVARLALALVMFPHGAQKILGWFGGYGFSATLKFFTGTLHIPAPLALLAFAAEFLGPLALAAGLFSRLSALGIGFTMAVAAVTVHLPNGFFMNWNGSQAGEGIEYFVLAVGLALVVVLEGGGRYSLDSRLSETLATKTRKP